MRWNDERLEEELRQLTRLLRSKVSLFPQLILEGVLKIPSPRHSIGIGGHMTCTVSRKGDRSRYPRREPADQDFAVGGVGPMCSESDLRSRPGYVPPESDRCSRGDWFLVVRCGIDLFWWYVYTVYSGLFMIVYWVYFGREWNVERGAGWNRC